jgi:hypothetical protein
MAGITLEQIDELARLGDILRAQVDVIGSGPRQKGVGTFFQGPRGL